jgi:hypothetical protein
MATDLQSINRNDLGVMIAGVVAFIASFFPFVGLKIGPFEGHDNAWRSYAVLGLLLLFAAAILIAVKTFAGDSVPEIPVGTHVLSAGLAGLGTLILILNAFTASESGVDLDVRWGAYVLFIAGIAEVVFSVLGVRESGESVPGVGGSSSAPPPAPPAA